MHENYPEASDAKVGMAIHPGSNDRTVAENIDVKIAALKKEIDRLEASKKTLAPLMDMKIRDIREAMSY